MTGHVTILSSQAARDRAKFLIDRAPPGYICEVKEPKRTLDQNAKFYAMLTDVSVQKPMGRRLTPDDWKAVFMNACGWECQFIEGLDGRPFPQGFRSSQLTKSQMSTLIEFMLAWGAENGIVWSDEQKEAA